MSPPWQQPYSTAKITGITRFTAGSVVSEAEESSPVLSYVSQGHHTVVRVKNTTKEETKTCR